MQVKTIAAIIAMSRTTLTSLANRSNLVGTGLVITILFSQRRLKGGQYLMSHFLSKYNTVIVETTTETTIVITHERRSNILIS